MSFLSLCRHCCSEPGLPGRRPQSALSISFPSPLLSLLIHAPVFFLLPTTLPSPANSPPLSAFFSLAQLLISVPELAPWKHPLGSRIILQVLQELSAGSCSALCCSLARGTTAQGDTSGLVCLGVGLPVLGNEEGLERLCRTDRMGFGAVWRS